MRFSRLVGHARPTRRFAIRGARQTRIHNESVRRLRADNQGVAIMRQSHSWNVKSATVAGINCLAILATTHAQCPPALLDPVSYAVDNDPFFVTVADLNGDGWPDIVTANQAAFDASVLLNNGDGTMADAVNYAAGSHVQSVAVGEAAHPCCLQLTTGSSPRRSSTPWARRPFPSPSGS
jgi:hypothetical protein